SRKGRLYRTDSCVGSKRVDNVGFQRGPFSYAGTASRVCALFARFIRSRRLGVFIASQRSTRRCVFSQNSAELPKTRARISAVSAVTLRRFLHSSLTCLRGNPVISASSLCVIFSGSRNSSTRISP